MRIADVIRSVMIAAVTIGIIVFWGVGSHGNAAYSALMVFLLVPAYWRGFEVTYKLILSLATQEKFEKYKLTWVEMVAFPETVLMLGMSFYVHWNVAQLSGVTPLQMNAAIAGAVVMLLGVVFTVWTIISWSTMFVGHAIPKGHELIIRGIYARVRHPMYLAVVLIWAGLSLGTLNLIAGLLTMFYVLPVYLLYIKSEEEMMIEHFGDAYREYKRNVGMLIPSLRAHEKEAAEDK